MVVLGLILLLIGILVGPPVLTYIGLVLIVVGLILNFVPIGGSSRRVFWRRTTTRLQGLGHLGCPRP